MAWLRRGFIPFLAFFLHIFLHRSYINGELIYGSDTEVLVLKGTDFNLTCQATIIEKDDGIRIRHEADTLYQSFPPDWHDASFRHDKYDIAKPASPSGTYNMTILNAREKDAGIYVCEIIQYTDLRRVFRVFVLDHPKLDVTGQKEGVDLRINCQAKYAGVPDYELKANIEAFIGNVSVEKVVMTEKKGKIMTVSQNFSRVARREDHGQTLKCRISSNDGTTAIQTSTRLNVKYSPKYLELKPMKTVYKLGDIVSCHGEGNPKPKYRWTSKYGVVKEGSDLAITYDLTGSQSWNCTSPNHPMAKSDQLTFGIVSESLENDPFAIILFQIIIIGSSVSFWLSAKSIALIWMACRETPEVDHILKMLGYLTSIVGTIGLVITSIFLIISSKEYSSFISVTDIREKCLIFTWILAIGVAFVIISDLIKLRRAGFTKSFNQRPKFFILYSLIRLVLVIGTLVVLFHMTFPHKDQKEMVAEKKLMLSGVYLALYGGLALGVADIFVSRKLGDFKYYHEKKHVRTFPQRRVRGVTVSEVDTELQNLTTESEETSVRRRLRRNSC